MQFPQNGCDVFTPTCPCDQHVQYNYRISAFLSFCEVMCYSDYRDSVKSIAGLETIFLNNFQFSKVLVNQLSRVKYNSNRVTAVHNVVYSILHCTLKPMFTTVHSNVFFSVL